MHIDDQVLYYEPLIRDRRDARDRRDCTYCTWRTTCPKLRGSQTIFAHVIVRGEIEDRQLGPGEVVRCGGRTWDRIQRVEVVLPENEDMKHPGVPLSRVREVIGNRPMYGMQITEEQLRQLAAELKQAVERAAGPDTPFPQ
jgi:hypothetical protein